MSSFKTRFLGLVLVFAGVTIPLHAQIPDEMRFAIDPGAELLWVAVDEGASQVPWEVLPPSRARMLRIHSRANQGPAPKAGANPCKQILEKPDASGAVVPTSFADAVDKARSIVKGTVSELRQGFLNGIPFTLLFLHNPEVYKAPEGLLFPVVYVAYPRATIRVGTEIFCTADTGFPPLPKLGDELFIISFTKPRDLGGQLIEVDEYGLLIERSPGDLEMASLFREVLGQAETLEDVSTIVEKLLGEVQ